MGGSDKTKEDTTGGSFGYGKSVYSNLSDARTVAYYSVFEPDARSDGQSARFIISSLFDSHTHGSKNNTGRAYLAIANEKEEPVPAIDEAAHRLAEAFGTRQLQI